MKPLRFNFDTLASALEFLARAEIDNPDMEFHPPIAKQGRAGTEFEILAIGRAEPRVSP